MGIYYFNIQSKTEKMKMVFVYIYEKDNSFSLRSPSAGV